MGLCAVSRWCEGCRNKGKAQLSSALDRISERITPALQTLSHPEVVPGSTIEKQSLRYISIGHGGESVRQSPLKDKAFSTFLNQNLPFELRLPRPEPRYRPGSKEQIAPVDATAMARVVDPVDGARVPSNSTSAFRAPLRKFEHKARRRRMREQPILCISDARLGGSDAAAGVEHAALGADHAARLAHAAHE